MALESFAIHCRALILFLFGHLEGLEAKGKEPQRFASGKNTVNDIFAWDYDPDWPNHCPEPSEEMYYSKLRADKHVAHITTHRRGVNQPGGGESIWQISAAVNDICRNMLLWLSKSPMNNLDPDQARAMNELLIPSNQPTLHVQLVPLIVKSGPQDSNKPAIIGTASTAISSVQSFLGSQSTGPQ